MILTKHYVIAATLYRLWRQIFLDFCIFNAKIAFLHFRAGRSGRVGTAVRYRTGEPRDRRGWAII